MKKIVVLCTMSLLAFSAAVTASSTAVPGQGPFGFQWGMTKDQIIELVGQKSVKEGDSNGIEILNLSTAPKPHPAFESYTLILSPERGLLKIVAVGKTIQTNGFGSEVHDAFIEMRDTVSATYGSAKTFDLLKSGSIWNEPREWMMGLLKKERILTAYWNETAKLPNHITVIELEGEALSRESGYLSLAYQFEGFSEYLQSQKAKAGSVF